MSYCFIFLYNDVIVNFKIVLVDVEGGNGKKEENSEA
jgi:hypothetical protein